MTSTGPTTLYRLRGEVGGIVRAFPLATGSNRVGSSGDGEVVLPVRGVSRRHAVVEVSPDGLTLQDEGSRNGTFVAGVRVQRTRLAPGDEIRFGPVALQLEAVDTLDADLAIDLQGDPVAPAGLPTGETLAVGVEEFGDRALVVVEAFLDRLAVRPDPDLAGALEVLRRESGAAGACLLSADGGEPVVVASAGAAGDIGRHRGVERLLRERPAGGPSIASESLEDPPLALALLGGAGPETLGLALLGERRASRTATERLLRVLLTLVGRFRPEALSPIRREPGAPDRAHGLVFPEGYVAGNSPAMLSLYGQMKPLVQGDLPVVLLGETGVGKECVARSLHLSSARRSGPFVAVNCAAIPADLLEAEMFGIGKGVATGVVERPGKFQLAQGGTLFLDEIAEMPSPLQVKLLRALQQKEVQPVGGSPVGLDIRVIAATNSDLHRRMEEGAFRRDLYYRVAGYALLVPPLRERREDVPGLVEAFVRAFSKETGKPVRGITVRALNALVEYGWPGNVRELEHEVRRLVYLCPEGQALESGMLSPHILVPTADKPGADAERPLGLALEAAVEQLERRLIREALARAGGNHSEAARLLGVSRNGLAHKMQRFGITD